MTTELGGSSRDRDKLTKGHTNSIDSVGEKSLPTKSRCELDVTPPEDVRSPVDQMQKSVSTAKLEIGEKSFQASKPLPEVIPTVKIQDPTTKSEEKKQHVSVIQEIDPNFETDELEAELKDSFHHNLPPQFLIKHAPAPPVRSEETEASPSCRASGGLTSLSNCPVLLANIPIFKRNKSPLGEDTEDLIGVDIELVEESPATKRTACAKTSSSRATADNSSGNSADMLMDAAAPTEKKELVGPQSFLAMKLLGKGSFGEVYLVQKTGSQLFFAMKVLSKAKIMSQNLVRYILTERKVLSASNHPFIVGLHYAFQSSSHLFLVLDYCPGGDLSDYLRKERK